MWGPEWGWKDADTNLLGSLSRIIIYSGNILAKLELERDNRKKNYIIRIIKIVLKIVDWKEEKINVTEYMVN